VPKKLINVDVNLVFFYDRRCQFGVLPQGPAERAPGGPAAARVALG
jgi:hypothetical protein